MTERVTAEPDASGKRASGAPLRRHPAIRIAVIYVAARLVTTGLLLLASALSPDGSRFGRGATLGEYVLAWDAQWYWKIAVDGYPTILPLTDAGDIAQNAWAFMPVFPFLSLPLGGLLGGWGAGALVIAFVAGYLCCLVLRDLSKDRIGETAALWSVVFFAFAPLAVMFQVAYAETLFLLLILLGIRCLQRRRYGWLYAIVPIMAFTRPGVLAFALLIGLFGIWRWLSRSREPLRRSDVIHIVCLGALAVITGFTWQVIAAVTTGDWHAYLGTELSWRRLWVGDGGGFVPFEGWVQAARLWFPMWGLDASWGIVALIFGIVAVIVLLLCEPHVRRLGVETRLWSAAYLVYLLAVFFPQSSVFRLLLPLSPLWGAFAQPKSVLWRAGVLAACLVGQWWWIWNMYGIGSSFWQIP